MAKPTRDESAVLIDDACARNAAVELQYRTTDGDLHVAKSRILGIDADQVFLDSPHGIGDDVVFGVGQTIDGYVHVNEIRYAFKSKVVRLHTIVKINEEKRTVGMIIARPDRVMEGQRRTHFRVSLLARDPLPIQLHAAIPDGSGTCPIDAYPFEGSIVNLSIGGAALAVPAVDARTIRVGDEVFMMFCLAEEHEEFYFLAEVRQIWAVAGETPKRIGVKIKPWPGKRDLERTQQRLQRYITKVQRERLRRAA